MIDLSICCNCFLSLPNYSWDGQSYSTRHLDLSSHITDLRIDLDMGDEEQINWVCSGFSAREEERGVWGTKMSALGVHSKWGTWMRLSKPGMYYSSLCWEAETASLGWRQFNTPSVKCTQWHQFLLLKDNDLTSSHLIVSIHISWDDFSYVYLERLWQRLFHSFLVYCPWKSNFPWWKSVFPMTEKSN